jgi:ABC-type lipoprotein release transport system permease subunit
VAALASLLPSISYALPVDALVAANLTALLLGVLASIMPARRAARMSVTSALAYE